MLEPAETRKRRKSRALAGAQQGAVGKEEAAREVLAAKEGSWPCSLAHGPPCGPPARDGQHITVLAAVSCVDTPWPGRRLRVPRMGDCEGPGPELRLPCGNGASSSGSLVPETWRMWQSGWWPGVLIQSDFWFLA